MLWTHLTAYPQVAFSTGGRTQARIVPTTSWLRTIQDFLCSPGRAPPVAYLAGLIVVTPYAAGSSDTRAAGLAEAHADVVLKYPKLGFDADYTAYLQRKLVEWYARFCELVEWYARDPRFKIDFSAERFRPWPSITCIQAVRKHESARGKVLLMPKYQCCKAE